MSVFAILALSGQVVQIVAGFILSVEVIGLERVAQWSTSISLLRQELKDGQKKKKFFSVSGQIPRIIGAVSSVFGGGLFFYLQRKYQVDLKSLSYWKQALLILGGATMGGIAGICLSEGVLLILRVAVSGLRAIESRSRARSSGILGFLLLLLGFLLQFAGTLGENLFKPSS